MQQQNSFRKVSFESIDQLSDQNCAGGDQLNYPPSNLQTNCSQKPQSWVKKLSSCLPLSGCCQSPSGFEESNTRNEKKLPIALPSSYFSKDCNGNNNSKRYSLRKASLPSNDSKLALIEMGCEKSGNARRSSNISICSAEFYQSFDFLQNTSFPSQPTCLSNSSSNFSNKSILKDFAQCDQKIKANFDQTNNPESIYTHPNFCESSFEGDENKRSQSTSNFSEQKQSTTATQPNSLSLECDNSDKVETLKGSYNVPQIQQQTDDELNSNDNSLNLSISNEKSLATVC